MKKVHKTKISRKNNNTIVFLSLGVVGVVGVLFTVSVLQKPTNTNSNADMISPAPTGTNCTGNCHPGIPAIKPTTTGMHANNAGPANVTVPTTVMTSFTIQDATDYIQAHPFQHNSSVNPQTPTIENIVFMSSSQASKLSGDESVGLPDSATVLYVREAGSFELTNLPQPANTPKQHFAHAVRIFDAETGNLLEEGEEN